MEHNSENLSGLRRIANSFRLRLSYIYIYDKVLLWFSLCAPVVISLLLALASNNFSAEFFVLSMMILFFVSAVWLSMASDTIRHLVLLSRNIEEDQKRSQALAQEQDAVFQQFVEIAQQELQISQHKIEEMQREFESVKKQMHITLRKLTAVQDTVSSVQKAIQPIQIFWN